MFVTINEEQFAFQKVEIIVLEQGIHNLFSNFNKMTLQELVCQKKYEQLKELTEKNYVHLLEQPAGRAIQQIKNLGHPFYKQFLNNYGDLEYSRFAVKGSDEALQKNGVYIVIVDNELVFCGVCARTFKERFNQHIGSIYAKGCFRDGTATHCHINANITQKLQTSNVHFGICPIDDKKEMNDLKNAIIKRFEPEWNLRSNQMVMSLIH
ncbi:hypothetical protein CSE16_11180 [Solibacillus sp. R5-41]|uniref:hypothetical protein n=1 Tax=Solibacillus sp. R5-41 TaxID=2048654 RepID=UPI000C125D0B|nr:hypothetical protein [Solibacillus sp. R5-41]ATP40567.1 hypothetical protein CSE16_11180 [Solibacillus sp. R5-41]